MINIEKNIPIKKRGKKQLYPFDTMEVGDSFFAEGKKRNSVYISCREMLERRGMTDRKFTFSVEENGVRVWRIK